MIQCKVVSEEESCPVAGSATDAREMYNLPFQVVQCYRYFLMMPH